MILLEWWEVNRMAAKELYFYGFFLACGWFSVKLLLDILGIWIECKARQKTAEDCTRIIKDVVDKHKLEKELGGKDESV